MRPRPPERAEGESRPPPTRGSFPLWALRGRRPRSPEGLADAARRPPSWWARCARQPPVQTPLSHPYLGCRAPPSRVRSTRCASRHPSGCLGPPAPPSWRWRATSRESRSAVHSPRRFPAEGRSRRALRDRGATGRSPGGHGRGEDAPSHSYGLPDRGTSHRFGGCDWTGWGGAAARWRGARRRRYRRDRVPLSPPSLGRCRAPGQEAQESLGRAGSATAPRRNGLPGGTRPRGRATPAGARTARGQDGAVTRGRLSVEGKALEGRALVGKLRAAAGTRRRRAETWRTPGSAVGCKTPTSDGWRKPSGR